jgi:hypothetical protein
MPREGYRIAALSGHSSAGPHEPSRQTPPWLGYASGVGSIFLESLVMWVHRRISIALMPARPFGNGTLQRDTPGRK